MVGITDLKDRPISSLSGGQMSRTLFARMIGMDPNLILLDEPFNAIDQQTVKDLMDIVINWHKNGKNIIAVLHDDSLVKKFFHTNLLLTANNHLILVDTNFT
jgi:zinc/manganese transport system ATP-binding protein